MKRVLLLKPGVTSSKALLGDYEAWFGAALVGLARLEPVELHAGERVPSLRGVDGLIMTGSPLSVTEPTPWMREAADVMVEAADGGLPVLGVCFGHQLLAWRLGARVQRNPRGLELGSVPIRLTEEGQGDPLFDGLPVEPTVQATHFDEVASLPPGGALLATNAACPVQAYGVGPTLRGVQFHPEMNATSIRYCIRNEPSLDDARRTALDARAVDAPWGTQLLRNFIERFERS
ncbi:MAG: GMP synthase [Myxococcaceae bacterium]|jgi:GMP synthase (glutamine-hydrolysing)|nr:GMP synthase [Myxococcaceae bacterium]